MSKITRHVVVLRTLFGSIWAIDAVMKWMPGFRKSFGEYITGASRGQPHWLNWWFGFWLHPLVSHNVFFLYATAVIETLVALSLLLGLVRKTTYILGAVFSFLIWGIAEGFGGPYSSGSTDIGAAIIYVLVFYALDLLEQIVPNTWSLDRILEKHILWWKLVSRP